MINIFIDNTEGRFSLFSVYILDEKCKEMRPRHNCKQNEMEQRYENGCE